MEKARQPRKPLLNILNHPKKVTTVHLKPLSLYCRLMAADTREGSLPLFRDIPPSPFSEMVVKNIELKRKLDDSCLDDSIETPAKKPYIPSTVSPDLGVGDSFNVVTPETGSQHGPLERQAAIRRQTEDALAGVKSHLNLSSSSETSDGSPPNDVISKTKRRPWSPYIVNRGDVFNFNIDNILSLSPITCDAGPATRATKRCLCDRSPTAGQQVGERGEEPSAIRKSDGNGASNSAAAAVQVNGGHLPHGPLQFLREVGGSFQPLLKPLKPCQVHAAPLEGNQDLKEVLRTISSPSAPSWADVEASEIKVFDEFDCGPPLFESTICEAGEGEGHTMESSFEDSLPLQVQVGCTYCNCKTTYGVNSFEHLSGCGSCIFF